MKLLTPGLMSLGSSTSPYEGAIGRKGLGIFTIEAEHPDKVLACADNAWIDNDGRIHLRHWNSYVGCGLNNALALETGLASGTAAIIGFIGISAGDAATAPAYGSQFLFGNVAGTLTGASQNTIIKALSPALSLATNFTAGTGTVTVQGTLNVAAGPTVFGGATFANADFTSSPIFTINRVGFLTKSTDAGFQATGGFNFGALIDIIGGNPTGSAPWNRTFTINLSSAGTFTLVAQIQIQVRAT